MKNVVFIVAILCTLCQEAFSQIVYPNQDNDLFREEINYEKSSAQNPNPSFSGNIGSVRWQTSYGINNTRYNYDNRSQLTSANNHILTNGTYHLDIGTSVSLIDYDEYGNIKELIRPAQGQAKDHLTYQYKLGGQLEYLNDFGDLTSGYTSDNVTTNYSYDENGNMIFDPGKDVEIKYNFLNLPDTIVFGSGDSILIFYNSEGEKYLKRSISSNGDVTEKIYSAGIEYEDSDLDAIYFEEGRIIDVNGAYQYEYVIKDHLGNSRIMFSDLDGNHEIDPSAEVLQESHYYPFGMTMDGPWQQIAGSENPYQFNGKEINKEFDLNWLDYGARWYDPSIARWHAVDPAAERFFAWSPYNYVLNNPVRLIDPDGQVPGDPYTALRSFVIRVLNSAANADVQRELNNINYRMSNYIMASEAEQPGLEPQYSISAPNDRSLIHDGDFGALNNNTIELSEPFQLFSGEFDLSVRYYRKERSFNLNVAFLDWGGGTNQSTLTFENGSQQEILTITMSPSELQRLRTAYDSYVSNKLESAKSQKMRDWLAVEEAYDNMMFAHQSDYSVAFKLLHNPELRKDPLYSWASGWTEEQFQLYYDNAKAHYDKLNEEYQNLRKNFYRTYTR
ncbi:MAG: RHS repeat-associated core domain-containing protein [Flavobacteriales bacterium]|nr:RHS repeat-associated core domain-containing protein [Flavobacteriales bacterium]